MTIMLADEYCPGGAVAFLDFHALEAFMLNVDDQPVPHKVLQKIHSENVGEAERQAEIAAYKKILAMIDSAPDEFAARVHRQTLDFAVDEKMKFSYIADQVMDEALCDQRSARTKLQPIELFVAIERLMAGATSTNNFGHSWRWPLHTTAVYSKENRVPRVYPDPITEVLPLNFLGSWYKFGVHSFRVGDLTYRIVKMLEERYGLDFKALENERQKRLKAKS